VTKSDDVKQTIEERQDQLNRIGGEFLVSMQLNYAQLYRALIGVEPLGRNEAEAVVQLVGSLVLPNNPQRATRIERICAQISADNPPNGKPMIWLGRDGQPLPPPMPLAHVSAAELDTMRDAHANEVAVLKLQLEDLQRDHAELGERYDRLVGELKSIDAEHAAGHEMDSVATMKLREALKWA
jgi:hypothetical protein